MEKQSQLAVETHNLDFDYNGGRKILNGLTFSLQRGSRMLLIGANGTGKTTLLRILAGKHIHEYNSVRILGVSAYFETPKEDLTFLGSEWANNPIVRGDVVVNQLIKSMDGDQYHERRDALVELLDINTEWHMHQVSDGERRRVQILLGLLKPFELLLLDEVTVDLDVLVRADLLNYLQSESEQRGATIIYATHIFDGLNEWATHLAHLSNGKLRVLHQVSEVPELRRLKETNKSSNSPLLQLVEMWLRQEKEEKKYMHIVHKESVVQRLAARVDTDRFYNYWN